MVKSFILALRCSLFFVILFIFSLPVASQTAKGDLYQYDIDPQIRSIRIQAHHAHLEIKTLKKTARKKKATHKKDKTKKTTQLLVWHNTRQKRWTKPFTYKVEDQMFILSEKKFPSVKNAQQKTQNPDQILIKAPSLPLQIVLFKGKVKINKFLSKKISLSILNKGSFNISHTKGSLEIFQASGKTFVKSHQGPLTIHGENTSVQIQSCRGKIDLRQFKGSTQIENSTGQLSLHSFKTTSLLKKWTGKLKFYIQKGVLTLQPLTGSLSGFSQAGNIKGTIYPTEVDIETHSGSVVLNVPRSKAWTTIESWEGGIQVPNTFHRSKTGGVNRAKGRLKGSSKKSGKLSIKSRSGFIKIYQSNK